MIKLRQVAGAAISLVLAASLVACGGATQNTATDATEGGEATEQVDQTSAGTDGQAQATDASADPELTPEMLASYQRAVAGEGIVNTFITEGLPEGKVADPEAAEKLVLDLVDEMGGDKTTELEFDSVRPNANGMSVVTFTQRAGEIIVFGATAKLVLNADDEPIALVSSILPDVQVPSVEDSAISAAEAEQIVATLLEAQGSEDTIVEDASVRVIIAAPNVAQRSVCAWCVFTTSMEDGDHQAYMAHYLSPSGEYYYAMPVSEVGDPDAVVGQSAKASFDFDAMEPAELTVDVQQQDGSIKQESVPVLKDPKSGVTYLADPERKVLCADYATYTYGGKIVPLTADDGVELVDSSVYATFLKIWDFFDQIGWHGPDGDGTPALLLMNYVDANGEAIDNAIYINKADGFQVFGITRERNYGACVDVLAHEFTHCLTTTTMTSNIYQKDAGAINEALSDAVGNAVETILVGDAGVWTIGEGAGDPVRDMADPNTHAQPEFAWGTYYAPVPQKVTAVNDYGGVHINSSLLNRVSYRLDEAGMSPKEQVYFWVNLALVMSPQTDYPMLAEMLPWLATELGYDKYTDALKAAIDEAAFTATSAPDEAAEGCGLATIDLSSIAEVVDAGLVDVRLYQADHVSRWTRVDTWPTAGETVAKANVPAGGYIPAVVFGDESGSVERYMLLTDSGWERIEKIDDNDAIKAKGKVLTVEAGKTCEVEGEGFEALAKELLEEIDVERAKNLAAAVDAAA